MTRFGELVAINNLSSNSTNYALKLRIGIQEDTIIELIEEGIIKIVKTLEILGTFTIELDKEYLTKNIMYSINQILEIIKELRFKELALLIQESTNKLNESLNKSEKRKSNYFWLKI